MGHRSYDQYCGLATALDLLGERWTLLIVRDLVLGPQRYTDLLEGLPGIGTNLLASRLRRLESLGIIGKRVLPAPAASTVYELTPEGRSLTPALRSLARWGARYMPQPHSGEQLKPRTLMLGIVIALEGNVPEDIEARLELRLGPEVYSLELSGGRAEARQGPPAQPHAVIAAPDVAAFGALMFGRMTFEELEASGALSIEGDRELAVRLLDSFDVSFVGSALRQEAPAASA